MKVKSEREVIQLCPTLSDPMDCSLPGSSIQGIFQARVLEWGATAFSNNILLITGKYWVSQKVHLRFRASLWKNPNNLFGHPNKYTSHTCTHTRIWHGYLVASISYNISSCMIYLRVVFLSVKISSEGHTDIYRKLKYPSLYYS